jgi:hypothetical protein
MEEERSEDGDWKILHVDDYAEADYKLRQARERQWNAALEHR